MIQVKHAIFLALYLAASGPAKTVYDDDPLLTEPPPIDASQALPRKLSDYYDLFLHTLSKPGERDSKYHPIPAQGVNTLGEPMDGAWYTRRHYFQRMPIEQLVRGPGGDRPPEGRWTVVSAKSEGVTPGFTILDEKKRRYFMKFDPLAFPEMATAAEVISARFFHALGYHVADEYIVYFKIDNLKLGENVMFADKTGKKRLMTQRDLLAILLKVPQDGMGRYRAVASLQIPGKPLGPFRYFGSRKDDPNDTTRHEHRRDLRGLGVFCAWLNHDDSRAINTFDTLQEENGVKYIKHYLLDFGAALGSSSSRANSVRAGGEYLFGWKQSAVQFFTLGLAVPHWALAKYELYPAVGRIEGDVFNPETWTPEYPNPAFLNRLPDDEFWAAKQVMAFTDDEIRAIVKSGQISDPAAERYLADVLIKRRNKIGKAFFPKVLPLDRFRVSDGRLAFDDLAERHGMGKTEVRAVWFSFDNDTAERTLIAGENRLQLPAEILAAGGGYWVVQLDDGRAPAHKANVYLRKKGPQVEVVRVEQAR
jgi:hypothetical protein